MLDPWGFDRSVLDNEFRENMREIADLDGNPPQKIDIDILPQTEGDDDE